MKQLITTDAKESALLAGASTVAFAAFAVAHVYALNWLGRKMGFQKSAAKA